MDKKAAFEKAELIMRQANRIKPELREQQIKMLIMTAIFEAATEARQKGRVEGINMAIEKVGKLRRPGK